MKTFFQLYKVQKFCFLLLILVSILDPGNDLLHMKEVFFILTLFLGFFHVRTNNKYPILFGSIFIALFFPLLWLIFGYLFQFYFDFGYALMYYKAFLFFILINVCLDDRINYSRIFSISSLVIIPITIILYIIIGEVQLADEIFRTYDKTFGISRRAFGTIIFDPVIFYKTSPLLIFGMSFISLNSHFRLQFIKLLVLLLSMTTLIISGTRANMISGLVLFFIYLYSNYFSTSKLKKLIFISTTLITGIISIIPFMIESFFSTSEPSHESKLSLINDYFIFWQNNPQALIFGQGLGGGYYTVERGVTYMAEPTYFEIVRMFGLLGGFIIMVFICIPLYLFIISRSAIRFDEYKYVFVAYLLYVFIEIPSNPLLLASTGMIVMVVVYSAALKLFYSRKINYLA